MKNAAVIMAGGSGTRFWPFSRKNLPKQYLPLFHGKSLFQLTVERMNRVMPLEHVFVVTNSSHLENIKLQAPGIPVENIILEPEGRDTAPAIGLAALVVSKKLPGSVMIVCPADHMIADEEKFTAEITGATRLARQTGCLLTIGIQPDSPQTGYGYIEAGEKIASYAQAEAFEVCSFREKPDKVTAEQYLAAGNYWWNSGIFIWQTTVILEELSTHQPDIYMPLMELGDSLDTPQWNDALSQIFPSIPRISIDYGVLEKSRNILTIQGSFSWDDLGSWNAFAKYLVIDDADNAASGEYIAIDAARNIIFNRDPDRLVALSGVSHLIIVETEDILLVCDRRNDQSVKQLVEKLAGMESGERYL